ncbi:MAG: HEAT repeat domain-containing protein [Planctomycetota bacterium]
MSCFNSFAMRRLAKVAFLTCLGVAVNACGDLSAIELTETASSQKAWTDVADLVRSADADLRAVGIDRVREGLVGESFTRQAADLLSALPADAQVALLAALAGRGDPAAVPAVRRLADAATDPAVRGSALKALATLGGAAEIPILVKALAVEPVKATARKALVEIRGDGVTSAIAAAAGAADPGVRALLVDALTDRRERAAMPGLLAAIGDADGGVRQAGIRGLTRLGGPDELTVLVDEFLKSSGDDRKALEQAVVGVCSVNRGKERATPLLLARFTAADDDARDALLPVLARLGDPQTMRVIDGMIADPIQRRRGLEALAKWPDATVADRLLDLFSKTTEEGEKALLLGALIRVSPLPDNKLNDSQKLELVKRTMGLCQRNEDKVKLIERANAIRTIETLRFVVPFLDQPELAEPACLSVVELAHHQKLRDANKAEFTTALDKVLGITKNEELVERATRYKAGQTWDRNKKS